MRFAPTAVLVLAVVGGPAAAVECDFLPETKAPAWVSGAPGEKGYYTGVGQAPADNAVAAQSIERAKQAALRDLAQNIEVFVRNELRVQETAAGTPGALQSQIEVESSTETAASALLGEVQSDGNWLDHDACVVWTRVKIEEAVVRALQVKQTELTKLKLLKTLLKTAEDSAAEIVQREKALEQAASLYPRVDYSYARDGSTEDYFRGVVEKLRQALAKARGTFDVNARDFAAAEQGLQQARRESGIAEQARLATGARDLLTQVSASAPYNAAPDYWPERATLALAEFERDTGNPCEARKLLDELANRSTASDWSSRARATAAGLPCSPEQRQGRALRRMVYGQDVQLLCVYKLGKQSTAWDRACADTQALLAAHGALQVRVPDVAPAEQVKWVEQCRNGCTGTALSKGLAVVLYAQGDMRVRKNPDNPMGADHQYKGQVNSFVLRDGATEFNDQYNGIGGWNPVSAEMAMDVLAIQAGRRFRDKAAAHYGSR